MLYSIDHAVGVARDLADDFRMRFAGSSTIDTVRQSQDSAGWPVLFLSDGGNEAAGQPVIALRLKNINVGASDIFGNASLPFTPTQCEFAFELNGAGRPFPSTADFSIVLAQVARTGVIIAEEAIANGTAVTVAAMDAAEASASPVIKDIDWGNKGNT